MDRSYLLSVRGGLKKHSWNLSTFKGGCSSLCFVWRDLKKNSWNLSTFKSRQDHPFFVRGASKKHSWKLSTFKSGQNYPFFVRGGSKKHGWKLSTFKNRPVLSMFCGAGRGFSAPRRAKKWINLSIFRGGGVTFRLKKLFKRIRATTFRLPANTTQYGQWHADCWTLLAQKWKHGPTFTTFKGDTVKC